MREKKERGLRFSVEIVPRDPLWRTCILANLCDSLGFDILWFSDHFFNRNVFITLATIAQWTGRAKIGPAVVNPYVYSPITIAQSLATLWELAPNRIVAGIGAGDLTSLDRLCIKRERPIHKVKESISVIRELLRGEEVSRVNDTICLKEAKLDFRRRYEIPIYIGAQGEKMINTAAEIADGVLINWSNFEKLKWAVNILKTAGIMDSGFDVGAHLIVSVHEDVNKARKTAIPFAAYLMAGSPYRVLHELQIGSSERELVKSLLVKMNWDKLYEVAEDSWVRAFSFYGTYRELRDFIEDLLGLGYTHVVFGGPLGPRVLSALKNISDIVKEVKRGFISK